MVKRKRFPTLDVKIDWGSFQQERGTSYNYVDHTTEDVPLCFYVGKGNIGRVNCVFARNSKHAGVASKYGIKRTVVAAFKDEKDALDNERLLIKEHKTYFKDSRLGSNFTLGGEGASGYKYTDEQRQRARETHLGKKHSDATRAKMGATQVGKKFTEERKENLAKSKRGKTLSSKQHDAITHAMQSDEIRQKLATSRCEHFAYLVPIHKRMFELLDQGLTSAKVAFALAEEFHIEIDGGRVLKVKCAHKKRLCKVCSAHGVFDTKE